MNGRIGTMNGWMDGMTIDEHTCRVKNVILDLFTHA